MLQRLRTYKGVALLCVAFLAVSASSVCAGVFMRNIFQRDGSDDSQSPQRLQIRVSRSEMGILEPHTHSSSLHAEAEVLKRLKEKPEQLRLYKALSEEEKVAWMEEKKDQMAMEDLLQVKGKKSIDEIFDGDRCPGLRAEYQPLVDDMLAPFKKGNLTVEYLESIKRHPSATFYIRHGKLYLNGTVWELGHEMISLWADYLYWLLQEVDVPDVVMPINPYDYPLSKRDPWFSFCRQPRSYNDLLLPNLVEDGLFPVNNSLQQPRAGRSDFRAPKAVWLGRPMAWGRGKRRAVVRESLAHPEQVYAGLTDWAGVPGSTPELETEWSSYHKPWMALDDWAEQFKYSLNVEGNCGSARLAKQLYADAVVFFVSGEDEEWYYPLLKPYVHFVPVTVQPDGTTDLISQIEWAESHPEEILDIVRASTAFAHRHLSPNYGRDCYTALLLSELSLLIKDDVKPPSGLPAYVSQVPPRHKATREE